ncbi:MAG TPA: histidine phosphatase family protein [Puia sp.]
MKKAVQVLVLIFAGIGVFNGRSYSQTATGMENLKVVIIRHGEKPKTGDNLTCQGVNRSLQLPEVLHAKFGIPAYTYIPAPGLGESTKHARMFQTIIPFAAKYNLVLNSKYEEFDSVNIAKDLLSRTGVVLMVWQHHAITSIVRALGVKTNGLQWDDNDFDSIWIITFPKGVATLTKDREGLTPSADCSY